MRKILILMLVMVFGLASVAFAGVEQGKSEIGVYVSMQSSDYADVTIINFNYGRFMTDEFQLTGNLMLMEAEDLEATALEVQGKFHFIQEGQEFIPYAGGLLGNFSVSGPGFSESAISYGFLGGVKYFVSEDTSVNLELTYRNIMFDAGDETTTALTAGFAIYF